MGQMMQFRGRPQQASVPPDALAAGLGAVEVRQGPADSLPAAVTSDFKLDWAVCGSGVLTWSVFRLYRATLHAPGGQFDASRPFALDLSYLRRIPASQIVERSIEEIRRLRVQDDEALARWQDALATLIPDVSLGSRLIGVFDPQGTVVFYFDSRRLGEIRDPQFAQAFAAIWLDPQTRSPELRARLLGEEPDQ